MRQSTTSIKTRIKTSYCDTYYSVPKRQSTTSIKTRIKTCTYSCHLSLDRGQSTTSIKTRIKTPSKADWDVLLNRSEYHFH